MSYTYGADNKTALQAKHDAQKIAFAPIMFQAARALRDLGILNTIQKHRKLGITIDELAAELNLSVYGIKVLVEAGLSLEVVYVIEDKWFITKTGWYLVNDDLTRVNMDFTQDVNYEGFTRLKDSILKGRPEGLKIFGEWETIYEALSQLPPKVRESWFNFDHYYSDTSFPEVLPLIFEENPANGLDVGGNTGKFAIQCAAYNPDVHITILDLPGQLAEAEVNIREKGFEGRISLFPVDLLDHSIPYPKGFDFVWMSQFLDCFAQDDIVALIQRAKAALNADGSLYILETYWDKQRYEASTYSLHATSLYFTCLANGCSQMYHHEDMLKLIDKAGMKVQKEYEDIGVSHTLYQCVRK